MAGGAVTRAEALTVRSGGGRVVAGLPIPPSMLRMMARRSGYLPLPAPAREVVHLHGPHERSRQVVAVDQPLDLRGRENLNSNSKTLFYKDCSLGSVKNLTTERTRNANSKTLFYKDCNLGSVKNLV